MKKKCISALLLSVLYTSIISRSRGNEGSRQPQQPHQEQHQNNGSNPGVGNTSGWQMPPQGSFRPNQAPPAPSPVASGNTSGWLPQTGVAGNTSGWVSTATPGNVNPAVLNTYTSPTTVKNMNDLSSFINYIMPQVGNPSQNNPQYIAILFTVSTDSQNTTSTTNSVNTSLALAGIAPTTTAFGGNFSDQQITQAFINEILNPTKNLSETTDVLLKNNIPLVVLEGATEYGVPNVTAATDTNAGIRTFISGLQVYFNQYQPASYQFMQTTIDTQSTATMPWGQKYWPSGRTFSGSVYEFIENTQKLDTYNPQTPQTAESAFNGDNSIGHPTLIIAAVYPSQSAQQGQPNSPLVSVSPLNTSQYTMSPNVYAILLKPAALYAKENNIPDIMPQLDSFIGAYLTNPTILGLAS